MQKKWLPLFGDYSGMMEEEEDVVSQTKKIGDTTTVKKKTSTSLPKTKRSK